MKPKASQNKIVLLVVILLPVILILILRLGKTEVGQLRTYGYLPESGADSSYYRFDPDKWLGSWPSQLDTGIVVALLLNSDSVRNGSCIKRFREMQKDAAELGDLHFVLIGQKEWAGRPVGKEPIWNFTNSLKPVSELLSEGFLFDKGLKEYRSSPRFIILDKKQQIRGYFKSDTKAFQNLEGALIVLYKEYGNTQV